MYVASAPVLRRRSPADRSRASCRSVALQKFIGDFLADSPAIEAFGGPSGYDDLLRSKSIDAVYVPLPVALKTPWVLRALSARKHVLLEKPAALSSADYRDVLAAALSARKCVLDGTMFPHHPRTASVLDAAADTAQTGAVDRIRCDFTFRAGAGFHENNIRGRREGDPHGCVGDLGWYCVRFGLMVFRRLGSEVRSAQVVHFARNERGVPIDATCVVRFENSRVLWFHCGFGTGYQNRAVIYGAKTFIEMDDFVLPADQPSTYTRTSSSLTECDLLTRHARETVLIPPGPAQEILLWKKFGQLCTASDADASPVEADAWAEISLTTQRVVDALMASMEQNSQAVDV
mmetsp:Transcript_41619/g.97433  ORF Transcript_41619/g.97433 Transcript_41619/m.97433 type:complete len:347 (-) Transcript_41619:199-1239(-)